jgi:hypothetical protein
MMQSSNANQYNAWYMLGVLYYEQLPFSAHRITVLIRIPKTNLPDIHLDCCSGTNWSKLKRCTKSRQTFATGTATKLIPAAQMTFPRMKRNHFPRQEANRILWRCSWCARLRGCGVWIKHGILGNDSVVLTIWINENLCRTHAEAQHSGIHASYVSNLHRKWFVSTFHS